MVSFLRSEGVQVAHRIIVEHWKCRRRFGSSVSAGEANHLPHGFFCNLHVTSEAERERLIRQKISCRES